MRTPTAEHQGTIEATVGYAAGPRGHGVAYARLISEKGERLFRVAFTLRRQPGLGDREVGYAALAAVIERLRERGARRVSFALDDAELVEDINRHRAIPDAIVLPYVRLRCALNAFERFALRVDEAAHDLAQRARAEVALHVAA